MVNRREPVLNPFMRTMVMNPKKTTLITGEGFGAVSNAHPKTATTQA